MTAILEHTFRSNLHRADAYRAIALVAPLMTARDRARVGAALGARRSSPAFYTAFMVAMVWLFPLFPAEPKLGPVYQPITHYMPLEFPMLIIVPAIAIDLVARAARALAALAARARCSGASFVATLVAAEWPFATFLQSPAARNAMFGSALLRVLHAAGAGTEPRDAFMPDRTPGARPRARRSSPRRVSALARARRSATRCARCGDEAARR